jgi:parvulin-like peptidyl-prolyl isomerase
MKKISKLLVLLGAVAPLITLSVTPDQPASTNSAKPAAGLDSLFADSVVAKGKGVEIKRNDLDSDVVKTRAFYAARNVQAPPNLEEEELRNLIIKQLILNRATDADRAKGKADFETRLAKLKTDNGFSDEEFNKKIATQLFGGETRAQWDQDNIDKSTIPLVLERELKINITDDQIKSFYDSPTNISAFEQPEMVRASHILLMTQDPDTHEPLSDDKKLAKHKQMEDILKLAKGGADFGELAKKYSEDPGSKDKGGEYTFPRGQMVKQFEDTAFSLKPGDISDIIETQFGYHIIKLSEKIPAKKVDFDKVKEGIKDHLMQVGFQSQVPDYTKRLIKDANVEILDDKLKGMDLSFDPTPKGAGSAPAPSGNK